jgi:hypothetical protein
MFLLAMNKLLQYEGIADLDTRTEYQERIEKVVVGFIFWLLIYGKDCSLGDYDRLDWDGRRLGEDGESSTGNEEPTSGPATENPVPVTAQEDSQELENPPLSPSSAGGHLQNEGATHIEDRTTEGGASEPERPLEPDITQYGDQIRNCCQLIRILDECRTQYPHYLSLIIKVIECRLKETWKPIEMSKHGGSHLWPDQLEYAKQYPYPYARFLDRSSEGEGNSYGGYGGQSIYVYNITFQILVWRAVKSMNRLLALVSKGNVHWTEWSSKQSLDEKSIRDRALESFRDPEPTDRFIFRIAGHERSLPLDQWNCDVVVSSFNEDFFMGDKGDYLAIWAATLRHCDSMIQARASKRMAASPWESFLRYQISADKDRRKSMRESLERGASSIGLFAGELVTRNSNCPGTIDFSTVAYILSEGHLELLYPQYKSPL